MKRNVRKYLNAAFAAVLFLSNGTARAEEMIQVKGSDTMVNLAQSWAEVYMDKSPDDFVAVTGGGSGTGFSSLISGTCDIAISSRKIKDKEIALAEKKGIHPKELEVGMDGLAVVVNPQNPVNALTTRELAGIFSGKITNWKEVGGKDEKIVVLSREVNSGTHVYFKEHVLRGNDPANTEEFSPKALLLTSSQAIADEVAGNTAAIGYYGMGYISDKHKAVAVAAAPGDEYILPEMENVINGKYPIARPLFLYTNGEPEGLVKRFVDFAFSEEGQRIVVETDFVPAQR